MLKQHPMVSQNVVESGPYLACDYSGVRGNMYTARGLTFTITQRQEMHNICSQTLGSSLRTSITWQWPLGHLETAVLTSHSNNYWHLDVWALFKCGLGLGYIRQNIYRGRATETEDRMYCVHSPVGHPSYLTCWTVKRAHLSSILMTERDHFHISINIHDLLLMVNPY